MKHITAIIMAILLVATPALAHDLTYFGPIKAKETKSVKVDLPVGRLTVEVVSTFGTKMNCRFSSSYGGIVFEQTNTTKCTGNVTISMSTEMTVAVTNLEDKESDYKIWVHDSK